MTVMASGAGVVAGDGTRTGCRWPIGHRRLLLAVDNGRVWWDPTYNGGGGYLRAGSTGLAAFEDLHQLIAVWEVDRAGLIEHGTDTPIPARAPRPARLTATGRGVVRDIGVEREGVPA